jgi:hypothetical protein
MQDRIAALLYVIIVASITFLYVDYKNIELLKHPLSSLHSLSAARAQADGD